MTAPAPSKWGNFFQQAVAGVEARLDNILAEGDQVAPAVKDARGATPGSSPSVIEEGRSRAGSSVRADVGLPCIHRQGLARSPRSIGRTRGYKNASRKR
jgi:hypothetical protein